MREIRIQQQKLRHSQWAQLGGVLFAVSFKCSAVFQQPNPFQVLIGVNGVLPRLSEISEVRSDQACQAMSSFHKTPKLNILPALAVAHCGIGYTLKKMGSIESAAEK